MSYFPAGITYRDGGIDSAFNSITSNLNERTRILQVKGRRQVRATEVIFSWSSLNKGDCFIIELDTVCQKLADQRCMWQPHLGRVTSRKK